MNSLTYSTRNSNYVERKYKWW